MIGNIFTGEGIGATFGNLLISPLLERAGGHSVISAICLVLLIAIGLVPSCVTFQQVVLLYVVVGSCLGMLNATANTMISWVLRGRNVGPYVNLVNACFGAGASSAPILFVLIERSVGNGLAAFSAIAAFSAVPAFGAWLVESPPPPPKVIRSESEEHPLHGLGETRGNSKVAGIDLGSRERYTWVTVVAPLMLVLTLGVGAEVAYAAWVYTYAIERLSMGRASAAYLNSLFWTTCTLGRICTVPLAAYVTPQTLLVPTIALEVVSIACIIAFPDSALLLWCATIGAGVGVCALYSNTLSLLSSYGILSAKTTAAMGLASSLGHMTIPNLVGLVIHYSPLSGPRRYDALMWLVCTLNVFCLLFVVLVVHHLGRHFTPAYEIGSRPKRARPDRQKELSQAL